MIMTKRNARKQKYGNSVTIKHRTKRNYKVNKTEFERKKKFLQNNGK